MATLLHGSVVTALVYDPQGENPKIRPLLLIDSSADIAASSQLHTVAITSAFADPIAPDEVKLPWHPRGQAKTGLRKPSVAKCTWQPVIDKADIREVHGFVPSPFMVRIIEIVSAL